MPLPAPHEADFSHDYGGNGVTSCGPVLAEFGLSSPFGRSTRSHRVRLYRGLRRVDFLTTITNHDSWVRYRAAFPTPIRDGTIVREIPFGAVPQPEGEWPAQTWLDYRDEKRGLALLNRGLPGNNVTDGVLMVSLLKGTTLRRPDAEGAMELGQTHALEYALVPHAGDWRQAGIFREGLAYNNPLRVVKLASGDGSRPRGSFLRVTPENAVCSAVRGVGGRLLVRVYEATGERTKVGIELDRPIRAAAAADLIGRPAEAKVYWTGSTLETHLGPFEIKTFLLEVE
jgi:alpha-mannosidase